MTNDSSAVCPAQALYAGLAPGRGVALYGVITYMDVVEGVFVPDGGMHSIAAGLAAAVEKAGARVRYEAPVTRILRRRGSGGAVTGVELAVASGSPLMQSFATRTCRSPTARCWRARRAAVVRRGVFSPSCLLWLAGVRGLPPQEWPHHNLHFGTDWESAFRTLIDGGLMPDPSILVTLPSVSTQGSAPAGCSTIYALEPVPNLDGRADWT